MTDRFDFQRVAAEGTGPVRYRTLVSDDLLYLRGHFVGKPVLPAVVQLIALAAEAIGREWPELTNIRRVTRLKFRKPIGPGTELELELVRPMGESRVEFVIRDAEEICSSGNVAY